MYDCTTLNDDQTEFVIEIVERAKKVIGARADAGVVSLSSIVIDDVLLDVMGTNANGNYIDNTSGEMEIEFSPGEQSDASSSTSQKVHLQAAQHIQEWLAVQYL